MNSINQVQQLFNQCFHSIIWLIIFYFICMKKSKGFHLTGITIEKAACIWEQSDQRMESRIVWNTRMHWFPRAGQKTRASMGSSSSNCGSSVIIRSSKDLTFRCSLVFSALEICLTLWILLVSCEHRQWKRETRWEGAKCRCKLLNDIVWSDQVFSF